MGGDIGEIQLGSERELYKYINHYAVVTKASSKIILVQVYITFALPDYSSEVIETPKIILWETYTPRPRVRCTLTTGENRFKGKIGRNLTLY